MRKLPDKFKVAFSFAGEQRNVVRAIAKQVEDEIGSSSVFFDEWYEYYLAGYNADLRLQDIYCNRSVLVVVCVSGQYGGKPWTLAEYEAVRARLLNVRQSADELSILPIRVGEGKIEGILFNTIVPDIRKRSISGAAKLIIDRLQLILLLPSKEKAQVLRRSSTKLGPIYNVPYPPPNLVSRDAAAERLRAALLDSENQFVGIVGYSKHLGLHGMGGVGKTVLSAVLAQEEQTRKAYPDGIIWLSFGRHYQLIERQAELVRALGEPPTSFKSWQEGRARLSEYTADKTALVILDDVWDLVIVEAFSRLGKKCRLLVTTRDKDVLDKIGAEIHPLHELEEARAIELLIKSTGADPNCPPIEAPLIARECGYLPLAVVVVGSLIRFDRFDWKGALHRLRHPNKERLESLKARLPDYEHPGVLVALEISIESLTELEREAFLDLAVFPEDVAIPEDTIKTMWSKRFTALDTAEDTLQLLVARSVLMRDPLRKYRLHDLYYDYLQAFAEDLPALHRQLVNGYKAKCNGIWHQGSDDGYFYKHLPHHLHSGYCNKKLWRNLLSDYDWIKAKLEHTDINSLIEDYAPVSERQKDLLLIKQVLRLSALALSKRSRHLSSQILGRLQPSKRPILAELRRRSLADSESQVLRPLDATLTPPGGTLLQTFTGHTGYIEALAVTTDGTHAITGASDHTARIWDLEAGTLRHTVRGHSRSVEGVAFSYDQRWIATFSPGVIFLWDFDTAQLVTRISHTDRFARELFFSNDNQKLIAWDGYEGPIWLVKLSSGEQQTVSVAKNVIACAGELCVIKCEEEPIGFFDIDTHKCKEESIALLNLDTLDTTQLLQSKSAEHRVQFTPDRTRIIGAIKSSKANCDQFEWRVWDAKSSELLHTCPDITSSPDVDFITTDLDLVFFSHGVIWRDSNTCLYPKSIYALNISSRSIDFEIKNSKGIESFIASHDAQCVVYSIPGGKHFLVERDNPKKAKLIYERGWSRDKPLITSKGNRLLWISGRSLVLSDLKRGRYKEVNSIHPEGVIYSYANSAANVLVTAGGSGSIKLWNRDGSSNEKEIDLGIDLRLISANEDYLIIGGTGGALLIFDRKTRKVQYRLDGHTTVIKAIGVLDKQHKCVTFASRGAPILWDLSTGQLLQRFDEPTNDPSIVAVAPSGDLAISVTAKYRKSRNQVSRKQITNARIIDVWDLTSGKRIKTFKLFDGKNAVHDLAFYTCNTRVIAACGDHKLRIANIVKGKVTHLVEGHKGSVKLVRLARDTFISASNDCSLRIWDLHTLDQLRVVECDSPVNCMQVMPGGRSIVFSTESGDVEVRDAKTGFLIADFRVDTRVTTISVSEFNIIFVGTADGIVHRLQTQGAKGVTP